MAKFRSHQKRASKVRGHTREQQIGPTLEQPLRAPDPRVTISHCPSILPEGSPIIERRILAAVSLDAGDNIIETQLIYRCSSCRALIVEKDTKKHLCGVEVANLFTIPSGTQPIPDENDRIPRSTP